LSPRYAIQARRVLPAAVQDMLAGSSEGRGELNGDEGAQGNGSSNGYA